MCVSCACDDRRESSILLTGLLAVYISGCEIAVPLIHRPFTKVFKCAPSLESATPFPAIAGGRMILCIYRLQGVYHMLYFNIF
jgi:hypothetical protein